MKAIILAAGRGSRLCKLTENKPKCMVLAKGKTLLKWQIDALTKAGINEIAVIKGYLAEKISYSGIISFENTEWATTNMVASLLKADIMLKQNECIISYADIIYPESTINILLSNKEDDIVITYNTQWLEIWEKRFDNPLEDAETFKIDKNGYLVEIGKKTDKISDIEGQYMGLLRFTPKGYSDILKVINQKPEIISKLDMTSMLQMLILSGVKIKALPVEGNWFEIDNEKDLQLFSEV